MAGKGTADRSGRGAVHLCKRRNGRDTLKDSAPAGAWTEDRAVGTVDLVRHTCSSHSHRRV